MNTAAMRVHTRRGAALFGALLASLVLAACGGGSGGSAGSPPATIPPAPTPVVSISATPGTVAAGAPVTLTWGAQNTGAAGCTASGAWTGPVAANGTRQVTPAGAGTATYTLTCGATSNSTSVEVTAPTVASVNSVAVVVDGGPPGTNAFNVPFVTVTVCRPGTSICQSIDHVLLDTGSYGLRLIAPLDAGLALPPLTASSGAAMGECGQFISGYTWGSVAQADVKLGGEVAPAQSIQIIGDAPGGVATVPTACTSTGSSIGSLAALGARGILGIGLFKQDCGSACASGAVNGTYYAYAGSACSPVSMPLGRQVSNPVAGFASDNNGVVLTMPAVAHGGAPALAGTLVFGIGTAPNNALGGATKYAANPSGNFTTVYQGTAMTSSFIDSGSNGLFFNDGTLAKCTRSTDFFCPPTAAALRATAMSFNGATSGSVDFTIEAVDTLVSGTVVASVGGPNLSQYSSGANTFDWGLPFFFGRRVFVGIESATASPYWAY